jgi:hypothetical protein
MPKEQQPSRDLRAHRRQTERQLLIGLILILVFGGGGLIAWYYGWGGLIGAMACIFAALALLALLWLLLTVAGRWAGED